MTKQKNRQEAFQAAILPTPGVRRLLAGGIVLAVVALFVAALSIPFYFESPSMWYKFGIDKTMLRTGKMLGLVAGLLIFLQLPLAGRSRPLERIFSFFGLLRQHRWHAWILATMALMHFFLVRLPEDNLLVPFELRFWPEWIGAALLFVIFLQLICTQWRRKLNISFHHWLLVHRVLGLLITAGLVVHVLFVSETFEQMGPPRTAVFLAGGSFLLLWFWVRTVWVRSGRKPYRVRRIEAVASDCTRVEMVSDGNHRLDYLPGQFAFASFQSPHVTGEPHPFTLSSTPSRPDTLQFTIRACGDWTDTTSCLKEGDRALIQGPFGNFSHLLLPEASELVMIAGGVGITPMLSMLRYMADTDDRRTITLVWSNRSPGHTPYMDEIDDLGARLTGLRHVPIFTEVAGRDDPSSRLNRSSLESILVDSSRKAEVFLCGPPPMMTQTKADLNALGFASNRIHREAFGF